MIWTNGLITTTMNIPIRAKSVKGKHSCRPLNRPGFTRGYYACVSANLLRVIQRRGAGLVRAIFIQFQYRANKG